MIFKRKGKKGFTLIETLIYSMLVSLIIGGILVSIYEMIQGSVTLNARIVAEEEVNFIFRKISWAMAGAYDINSPGAGDIDTALSIDKTGFPDNPIVFDLDSGNLRISRAGQAPVVLNNEGVTVSSIAFEHLPSGSGKPEGVKVTLFVESQSYQTTIYLRK